MDGRRIDGVPVTPRAGKPVEVNALWLRALDVAAALADDVAFRDRCTRCARRAATSFVARFVRADGAGLLDVVDGPDGDDASVRPNQLLAVSLPGGPLRRGCGARRRRGLPEALLTPLGLRSLAPGRSALPAIPPRRPGRARRAPTTRAPCGPG